VSGLESFFFLLPFLKSGSLTDGVMEYWSAGYQKNEMAFFTLHHHSIRPIVSEANLILEKILLHRFGSCGSLN
jgi:hypothetical protein